MTKMFLIRELGTETEESPEPALLGGLMCSEFQNVDELHARLRSGNFKLHPCDGSEALGAALEAEATRAAADDTGPAAVTGDSAEDDPDLREF